MVAPCYCLKFLSQEQFPCRFVKVLVGGLVKVLVGGLQA